jgi:hypothetical protein
MAQPRWALETSVRRGPLALITCVLGGGWPRTRSGDLRTRLNLCNDLNLEETFCQQVAANFQRADGPRRAGARRRSANHAPARARKLSWPAHPCATSGIRGFMRGPLPATKTITAAGRAGGRFALSATEPLTPCPCPVKLRYKIRRVLMMAIVAVRVQSCYLTQRRPAGPFAMPRRERCGGGGLGAAPFHQWPARRRARIRRVKGRGREDPKGRATPRRLPAADSGSHAGSTGRLRPCPSALNAHRSLPGWLACQPSRHPD